MNPKMKRMYLTHPEIKAKIAAWENELKQMVSSHVRLLPVYLPEQHVKDFATIKSIVCAITGVPYTKIMRRDRFADVAMTRHLLCFYARSLTGMTFSQIAKKVGVQDHTTVIHANERIKNLIETGDQKVCSMVNQINEVINTEYGEDMA